MYIFIRIKIFVIRIGISAIRIEISVVRIGISVIRNPIMVYSGHKIHAWNHRHHGVEFYARAPPDCWHFARVGRHDEV